MKLAGRTWCLMGRLFQLASTKNGSSYRLMSTKNGFRDDTARGIYVAATTGSTVVYLTCQRSTFWHSRGTGTACDCFQPHGHDDVPRSKASVQNARLLLVSLPFRLPEDDWCIHTQVLLYDTHREYNRPSFSSHFSALFCVYIMRVGNQMRADDGNLIWRASLHPAITSCHISPS